MLNHFIEFAQKQRLHPT